MKHCLLLLLFLLCGLMAQAQKSTVSGRVVGGQGEALPGSTVLERGTTNGTSTGSNGEFSLSVNPAKRRLDKGRAPSPPGGVY